MTIKRSLFLALSLLANSAAILAAEDLAPLPSPMSNNAVTAVKVVPPTLTAVTALFDIGEGSGARSSAARIAAEFASKDRARKRDLLIVISCDSKYHEAG